MNKYKTRLLTLAFVLSLILTTFHSNADAASYRYGSSYRTSFSSNNGGAIKSGCPKYSARNVAARQADGQRVVGTSANGNAIWMKRVGPSNGAWGGASSRSAWGR